MSLSTTQLYLRLALALLIPIFTRITTLYESTLSLLTMTIISGVAQLLGRSFNFDIAKRSAIAFAGSFVASYIADFAVLGLWARLVAAYAVSWNVLRCLFPGVTADHWVSFSTLECGICGDVTNGKQAYVKMIRQGQLISPLVVLPFTWAAILTNCVAKGGYLNTNGLLYRSLISSILVYCAIFNPMPHLTIFIWRLLLSASTRAFYDSAIKPADLVGVPGTPSNFKAPDTSLAAPMVDQERIRNISPPEKEKYWAEATLGSRRWKRTMLDMLPEVPEVQGRPSTRRRG
jgi:hypothetical protein